MAESQLAVMDDENVNEKVPETRPEFYYSEEQRAALEQLVRNGDGAFKTRLKEDNAKDFLSAREVKTLLKSFHEYEKDSEGDGAGSGGTKGCSSADSGVHSTYWPQMSDTEVPALDIGWPGSSGLYKGVTRVHVYTHPPKGPGPHIKQVVRKLIQEAHKVLAIAMDLLTDLQILQDLLDASSRRSVAVYIVLDEGGVPHFLDMCSRLQISAVHLRNLRVRLVRGCGLALSSGRLPGSLCSKYMLVDGEKVMFGSYSFTWSSSRMDRNTITVMTGQVLDVFDQDFRELYAISEQVDLYREFNITKPPVTSPLKKPKVEPIRPIPVTTSRFQMSTGDSKQIENVKVPAHKYHNPKYSLVFGNNTGLTRSLQDLPSAKDSVASANTQKGGVHSSFLYASKDVKLDKTEGQSSRSNVGEEEHEVKPNLKKHHSKKQLASFKSFLKGKHTHNAPPETIDEGTVTQHSPAQKGRLGTSHSPLQNGKLGTSHSPVPNGKLGRSYSPVANGKVGSSHSPVTNGKVLLVDANGGNDSEDGFEILEKPGTPKNKSKKSGKLLHRSVSLQAMDVSAGEEGSRSRRRHPKKNCIQQ
ncbi:protein FAM83F [Periophthalmus magnuspinnatus]|uniref:protein FAM83F n=1 Tax=Periophthalmus magnuspinnatus TaxID=409849 RepID=UPI00145BDCB7|nr:protein FAM83F [Periophthalmus magnuspinnatus]